MGILYYGPMGSLAENFAIDIWGKKMKKINYSLL
jgi:hypothetical protein